MSITSKTRKILWGRSGNRCAICRRELVIEATKSDEESIVGEECHIVAKDINGPRGDSEISFESRDNFENLILLCRVDHKLIDDQENTYTIDNLKNIKLKHENWVKSALTIDTNKEHEDRFLLAFRIDTGIQFLEIAAGSHAYQFNNDQLFNEEEVQIVGDFAQDFQDYGDIWDVFESQDRVRAEYELDEMIRNLDSIGFIAYGCKNREKMIVQGRDAGAWFVAYMVVLRKDNPLIRRKEENLENLFLDMNRSPNEYTNYILLKRT